MDALCSYVPNNFLARAKKRGELGRGAYGTVDLITIDSVSYAVKYISAFTGINQSALLDIDALVRFREVPDIIRLIGVCYAQKEIAIIMEPMDSDLSRFIRENAIQIRVNLLYEFMRGMIRTVSLLEVLNISHFDIKPQNILVKGSGMDAKFKMADFGLARTVFFSYRNSTPNVYAFWYRPPELLPRRHRNSFRIYAGDIWALGVTIVEFLTGIVLFRGMTENNVLYKIYQTFVAQPGETYISYPQFVRQNREGIIAGRIEVKNILTAQMDPTYPPMIEPNIVEILSRMLSLNPDDRPTAVQILQAFGEQLNPTFVATLFPQEHPRRINFESINLIIRVGMRLEISKASILIALEIFTRFLTEWIAGWKRNSDMIPYALDALRIAGEYNEDIPPSTEQIIGNYTNLISLEKHPNVKVDQVLKAERQLLQTIKFQIYNLNLSSVIQRACAQRINLSRVNVNSFAEPLTKWLI